MVSVPRQAAMVRQTRCRWLALLLLTTGLLSRSARAEPLSREQLAQSLFDEARTLQIRGDTARACAMFAESQRLDPAAGTYLNLALCHESEGRLATAQTELLAALSQARKDNRADREALANEHLVRLGPRVPKLTVTVEESSSPSDLLVELDGVALAQAAFGVPMAVDPGPHVLVAHAAGRVPFRWDAIVSEREETRVVVPALEISFVAPPHTAPMASSRRLSAGSVVALGVGAAFIVGAGISGGLSIHEKAQYESQCVPSRQFCDGDGASSLAASRTWAWVSTGALVGALAAGMTAYLLPRSVAVAPVAKARSAAIVTSISF
jgi:hypothetical protein